MAQSKGARDPTAPSALADPGLVLVRGSDRPSLRDDRKGWIMSVKLTNEQLVMMSAAAQRKDRCLSAPATIKGAAFSKVSAKLAKLGLASEIRAKPGAPIWRRDDAGQGYALKLTAAGLKAIAVDEGSQDAIEPGEAPRPQAKNGASPDEGGHPARAAAPRDGSKLALVIEHLKRADARTGSSGQQFTAPAACLRPYDMGSTIPFRHATAILGIDPYGGPLPRWQDSSKFSANCADSGVPNAPF